MAHPDIIFLDETPPGSTARPQTARRSRRCCRNFNGFGVLGCLFSVLGIFTLGLVSPFGLVLSLLGMTRRPRTAATVGTALGLAGTGFLALWGWGIVATMNAVDYEQRAHQTAVVLEQGREQIEHFRHEHNELPEGIEGNKLLITNDLNDAWGQSLRYEPLDESGYRIRSAGPDQQFDTADDLTNR